MLVFIVGGATYEEAKAVHEFNEANPGKNIEMLIKQSWQTFTLFFPIGLRVILGGTHIHNFESFCEELEVFANETGGPRPGHL